MRYGKRRRSSTVTVETFLYVERGEDGEEVELTIEGSLYAGSPGRSWGHPDTWSPPDPAEVEVTRVVDAKTGAAVELTAAELEEAQDRIAEVAREETDDGPDDDWRDE